MDDLLKIVNQIKPGEGLSKYLEDLGNGIGTVVTSIASAVKWIDDKVGGPNGKPATLMGRGMNAIASGDIVEPLKTDAQICKALIIDPISWALEGKNG